MAEALIKVGGMSCQKCVANVEGALRAVAGVAAAVVSLDAGEAKVDYDPAVVTVAALQEAVEAAGFDAA